MAHPVDEAGWTIEVHHRLASDQQTQQEIDPTKWSIWHARRRRIDAEDARAGNAVISPGRTGSRVFRTSRRCKALDRQTGH
jgi:hypothetical protein